MVTQLFFQPRVHLSHAEGRRRNICQTTESYLVNRNVLMEKVRSEPYIIIL